MTSTFGNGPAPGRPLPVDAVASYLEEFLTRSESEVVFDEVVESFDVTDKSVALADGSVVEAETSSHFFMDEELTSTEHFHEVWGSRSAWTPGLRDVRDRIEATCGVRFPVARCVYYADGSEGVDFHHDPPAYGPTDEIASLSLGAARVFVLRARADPADEMRLRLAPGSLLLLGAGCQDRYEHALPRDPDCRGPRINLTFRKYGR